MRLRTVNRSSATAAMVPWIGLALLAIAAGTIGQETSRQRLQKLRDEITILVRNAPVTFKPTVRIYPKRRQDFQQFHNRNSIASADTKSTPTEAPVLKAPREDDTRIPDSPKQDPRKQEPKEEPKQELKQDIPEFTKSTLAERHDNLRDYKMTQPTTPTLSTSPTSPVKSTQSPQSVSKEDIKYTVERSETITVKPKAKSEISRQTVGNPKQKSQLQAKSDMTKLSYREETGFEKDKQTVLGTIINSAILAHESNEELSRSLIATRAGKEIPQGVKLRNVALMSALKAANTAAKSNDLLQLAMSKDNLNSHIHPVDYNYRAERRILEQVVDELKNAQKQNSELSDALDQAISESNHDYDGIKYNYPLTRAVNAGRLAQMSNVHRASAAMKAVDLNPFRSGKEDRTDEVGVKFSKTLTEKSRQEFVSALTAAKQLSSSSSNPHARLQQPSREEGRSQLYNQLPQY